MKVTPTKIKFPKKEVLVYSSFLVFSWFIMAKTLRLTPEGNISIGTKLWSDFSATIPLIRSFSFGNNFPPEYPIFAGPPIRYHFLFFALVGMLEKAGIHLVYALNFLSVVSFFLLLSTIYVAGKTLFNETCVGFVAVILFLFNGSLSFLEFFKRNPINPMVLSNIYNNSTFPSFGPYDGKVVSAFWNLNIFTNQRHLALAYSSFILLFIFIYRKSKANKKTPLSQAVILGVLIGLFPFIHLAIFGALGISLAIYFLLFPKLRKILFVAGLISLTVAIPQILYMGPATQDINYLNPGYLVEKLNITNFVSYWFYNLGALFVLIPIAIATAKKDTRKYFLPFLSLFIIANIFQFSVEIAANHKFFNLFLIGADLYVANLLVKLWGKRWYLKTLTVILLFIATLSGIIDFFPVVNDRHMIIKDIPNNQTATFIKQTTPKDSVFLNASFLYDPASLAGRKIYLGWPYFSWSAGYDTNKRHAEMKSLLNPTSKSMLCLRLMTQGIDYIEIENPTTLEDVDINYRFFEDNFYNIYYNRQENISVYDVIKSCKQ
jgi:hypothetical protein